MTLMNDCGAQRIYMIGIKGTGMSSLALYLCDRGFQIAGWDVPESFQSENELLRHRIRIDSDPSCFKAEEYDAVIYSSAHENHQILDTSGSFGLPSWSYLSVSGDALHQIPTPSEWREHTERVPLQAVSIFF